MNNAINVLTFSRIYTSLLQRVRPISGKVRHGCRLAPGRTVDIKPTESILRPLDLGLLYQLDRIVALRPRCRLCCSFVPVVPTRCSARTAGQGGVSIQERAETARPTGLRRMRNGGSGRVARRADGALARVPVDAQRAVPSVGIPRRGY